MTPPGAEENAITPEPPSPQNPRGLRTVEPAEVRRLLTDACLLTLTGSGGCGKTRLALAAARGLAGEFADGVWLVELAPLADPSLVPQAVASVLGAREQSGRSLTETLSKYLASNKVLL